MTGFGRWLLVTACCSSLAAERLSFDEVARSHHEASFEELADRYGGPLAQTPVISVKGHPQIVWVRPDMGIGTVANSYLFAAGEQPRVIAAEEVERSLLRGYLPILVSRWRSGGLLYEQTAFTTLLDAAEVKSGHETQVVLVRMSVTHTGYSGKRQATLWAYQPDGALNKRALSHRFADYALTHPAAPLPETGLQPQESGRGELRDGARLLGLFRADEGTQTTQYERTVRWSMELGPGERRSLWLLLSTAKGGFDAESVERLRRVSYQEALEQRVRNLESILARGMRIQVPDAAVNNIYRAQILYNQTELVQAADRDYVVPTQGYMGVWAWEAMHMLTPLDAMGYHDDVRRALGYFLKRQGKARPDGKVRSAEGTFGSTGRFEESGWEQDADSTLCGVQARAFARGHFPQWMNSTGSVLYAIGEHYFYSKDRKWMEAVAPAVAQAAEWIVSERQQTRLLDSAGKKVPYYGLLPAGRAYDDPGGPRGLDQSYDYCFTDGYSWRGLARAAEALADIGHPDGRRLLQESAAYRADLLEVMRRVKRSDPALPPYPERVDGSDAWASFATTTLGLFDSGLLEAGAPAIGQMEAYTKKHLSWLGLTGRLYVDGEPGLKLGVTPFYVVISEELYHRAWLLRGETEKALLTFYSTLALAVDREALGTVERIANDDRRYAPFYMNSSASSRVNAMIRRTLVMEDGGALYLLAGVPRRWLEAGQKIEVEGGVTYFGGVGLRVVSELDHRRVRVELNLRNERPERLKTIRLRVPHPERRPMRQVLVDGKEWHQWSADEERITLPTSGGRRRIEVRY